MASEVVKFRNPNEFIKYYSDQLKESLDVYDIQVNKLGFIGFLLNLLGNTNFDAKQYYDSLFKESMVATSEESENLYFHSATYGYLPTFSTPSKAAGELVFDFAYLPKMLPGVFKREVIIGGDEEIVFDNEGYPFITQSKYKFIETSNGNYSVIITSSTGRVTQLPSAVSEIKAPFQDVTQYYNESFSLTLPNYRFGTYYPYTIEVADGHIADIKVSVKLKGATEKTDYDVKYIKYFEESFSKTVFLRKLTSRKFIIEFGSGVRGAYIPSAEINVKVKITKGKNGNLNKNSLLFPNNYLVTINYYDEDNGNLVDTLPIQHAQNLVGLDFKYSENGEDPLSGDNLRNDVVSYIQSVDMLMTQRDFYNIAQKFLQDFRFIFKKSNVEENIFYLCRVMRDKFQLVIPSFNHTIKRIDTTLQTDNITHAIGVEGFIEAESIEYQIIPSDCFSNAQSLSVPAIDLTANKQLIPTHQYVLVSGSDEVECVTSGGYDELSVGDYFIPDGYSYDHIFNIIEKLPDNILKIAEIPLINYTGTIHKYTTSNIQLEWDEVENANKYIIVKIINGMYYYSESLVNSFIDDGTNFIKLQLPIDQNLIYKPVLLYKDQKVISPFLYQYNSFMNWYDGYILDDLVTAEFSEMINTGAINFDIPVIYFNVEYNHQQKKTSIFLRSHQEINDYIFKITISNKSIYGQELTQVDGNNYIYEYTDTDGIFWESFQIELKATFGTINSFEGSTYDINQIYKIDDELRLLFFDNHIYSNPGVLDHIDKYIINIPFIDYDSYMIDPDYYTDKIKQFIIDDNIPGRRMISDSLQFRFLDSVGINSYYLEHFTIQKYDAFDLTFPLKLQTEIIVDADIVTNEKLNLADKKNEFLIMLADWLQKDKTGTQIAFYNSQVVDLLHTDQSWIKSVSVIITDANGVVIPNGIETLPEETGLKNIKTDKLGIVKFIPWYWHWNVDDIDIKMVFN